MDMLAGASESLSCARAGLEMPSFFIFEVKVVRFSPSLAAAPSGPPMTQPVARSTCRMRTRWQSTNILPARVSDAGCLAAMARGFEVAGRGLGSTIAPDLSALNVVAPVRTM